MQEAQLALNPTWRIWIEQIEEQGGSIYPSHAAAAADAAEEARALFGCDESEVECSCGYFASQASAPQEMSTLSWQCHDIQYRLRR